MASEFDEIWEDAETIVFETMGDAVSFTPKGGETVENAVAIIGTVGVDDEYDEGGKQRSSSRECDIQIGGDTGISDVNNDDIVTIAGVDWTVDDIMSKTATSCQVMLVTEKRKSKHHAGHVKT